ncbi:MAG: hypothetical protein PHE67_08415 [Campylobacterales bacterium]|nr:hypothetical protein [Campylobacterales bacterium]
MIKLLKKELLIYLAILVALSLYMHPERIKMIESPFQLVHTFAWSFGAYLIVALLRAVFNLVLKLFRRKQ